MQVFDSNLPSSLHKALLLLTSLGFIAAFGRSWVTPLFVVAVLTINFLALARLTKSRSVRGLLQVLNWVGLPAGFFYLQTKGWIGVLSGGTDFMSLNAVVLIGMPFYILSILAINHDVQAGKQPRPSWLDYVLFSVYFPKFISGPVEQPAFLQKLSTFRFKFDAERIESGFSWVVLGMFCKFIVAHYLAGNVAWFEILDLKKIMLSVVAFEMQVYFDLSGYSFMAYGVSKILGLDITLNFNHPFFAGDVRAFWQRWHVSLGRWFFQYVHTPLKARSPDSKLVKRSLPVLVFLLSAMWHGQTLNFVVWGLWHGLAYLVYVNLLSRRIWPGYIGLPSLIGVLLVGRMLFMEANFPILVKKISRIFEADAWQGLIVSLPQLTFDFAEPDTFNLVVAVGLCAGYLALEARNQAKAMPPYMIFRGPTVQWVMIILGLLLFEGQPTGFIYARQ